MTMWGRRLNARSHPRRARLALDVGTEYAKAVIVSGSPPLQVLGVGRCRQAYGSMEGGAVADIGGVVEACSRAVEEARVMAGVRPIEVVTGLAGQFVQGVLTTVQQRRRRPARPLRTGEVRHLVRRAERSAESEAGRTLIAQTGRRRVDMRRIEANIVDVKIDGYRVTSPVDFRGRHLEIRMFSTFAPLVHTGAIATVLQRLGLVLVSMVADPCAVAAGALSQEARDLGALVVDIGGGSTDIALVRNRAVVGAHMIAFGGRAFTKSIAVSLGLDLAEAETRKLEYAAGLLPALEAKPLEAVVQKDLALFGDAMALALDSLKADDPLPNRVYLCGGGSGLPGIPELFGRPGALRDVFDAMPVVRLLEPDDITDLSDEESLLCGQRDVTPKCLGLVAARPGERGIGWAAAGALSEARERREHGAPPGSGR